MSRCSTETNIIQQCILKHMLRILPADSALYHEEDLRPYECDGLPAYQQQAVNYTCKARQIFLLSTG